MGEVARLYEIDDFWNEVKQILVDTEKFSDDEINEAVIKIMDANKKLNSGYIEREYKLEAEIQEMKRQENKNCKVVQSVKFILERYGQE